MLSLQALLAFAMALVPATAAMWNDFRKTGRILPISDEGNATC